MDYIYLEECRFYGFHGAFEEEQKLGQIFVIDCKLGVDLDQASKSDDLNQTVHYGHVFDCIKKEVETKKYRLIEKLAGEIIANLFEEFPQIQEIELNISKENPPINGHYKAVAVSLRRRRS